MKHLTLKKHLFVLTALCLSASGFCANTQAVDVYPIGKVITNKVEVMRAAAAILEGYNKHVQLPNKEEKQADIVKTLSSINIVGIQHVPMFYPQTPQAKETREQLLKVSSYLVKNQTSYNRIRPDAAFCALQTALYLYPSIKFQNAEIDEARQQKIIQRAMHICPAKMKKTR